MPAQDMMQFKFSPMTSAYAQAIADWRYEGEYAFYDAEQDEDDLRALLEPFGWPDRYFAVLNEVSELVGFFCFVPVDGGMEIGLGLRPDLTGRGLGLSFVQAGLQFARAQFRASSFSLRVATFNKRAITVYKRAGFAPLRTFRQETNGGQHLFLEMVRKE